MKPLIILHLFYPEMWEGFNEYFKKLDVDFDLMVSITEDKKEIIDTIKLSYPEVKVFVLPNKGLDVGPFLHILKYLKENNLEYSHIVKLHTKKSHYNISGLGDSWRKTLVDCLIGNNEIFKSNLDTITNSPTYKMVGSRVWLLRAARNSHITIMNLLNIKTPVSSFIGGTMFICDYKIMVDFFTIGQLDELYNMMPNGYVRDHTFAHDMERVFGFIVEEKGFSIKGV